MENSNPKIKQDTLCKVYENGGFKKRWHYV